jgi:hypothetical protein
MLLEMPPDSDLSEAHTAAVFVRGLAEVNPSSVCILTRTLSDLLPDLRPDILAALGEQADNFTRASRRRPLH